MFITKSNARKTVNIEKPPLVTCELRYLWKISLEKLKHNQPGQLHYKLTLEITLFSRLLKFDKLEGVFQRRNLFFFSIYQ